MRKTTKKKGSDKEDMGKLLFSALSALEEEEGIPYTDAKEMVETALLASYNSQMGIPRSVKLKDTRPESEEAAGTHIVMDQKKRTIRMYQASGAGSRPGAGLISPRTRPACGGGWSAS